MGLDGGGGEDFSDVKPISSSCRRTKAREERLVWLKSMERVPREAAAMLPKMDRAMHSIAHEHHFPGLVCFSLCASLFVSLCVSLCTRLSKATHPAAACSNHGVLLFGDLRRGSKTCLVDEVNI